MQVVPAVDVLGDEAVRLVQGRFEEVGLRAGDPVALARSFAERGFELIHVVDLGGARDGRVRPEVVASIAHAALPAAIQASGGIRSTADAELLLEAGASRVVAGTAAFATEDAVAVFAAALGDRLVIALDVRDGRIAVRGWEDDSGLCVEDAAARCRDASVARVLCTAIDRDGTLEGPDLDLLRRVRDACGLPLLAAGGIASQADLDAVAALGCEGAIVGRALLEGSI